MWATKHLTVRVLALVAIVAACGDNHEGNTAPRVDGMSVVTDEEWPLIRTLDIVDDEGDPTTLTFADPPHGQVVMAGADTFMYLPDPDYNGIDAFEVTVSDGRAQATATVEITIAPINDAPAGQADSISTLEDLPITTPTSALLANDVDVDGDPLFVLEVGSASNGFVSLFDNAVTFFPVQDFAGNASYLYTVSDGIARKEVLVVVAVGDINDPPTAGDDFESTLEDTPLVIPAASLLANDFEPDGEVLTITAVGAATNGTVALAGTTITFTSAAGFDGFATFTYDVTDGIATATGTVFVEVVDAARRAVD